MVSRAAGFGEWCLGLRASGNGVSGRGKEHAFAFAFAFVHGYGPGQGFGFGTPRTARPVADLKGLPLVEPDPVTDCPGPNPNPGPGP